MNDTTQDQKYAALQTIGKGAAEGIAEMVAALELDYDRLDELRDALRTVCDEQHGEQGAANQEFKTWLAGIAADENCRDYYGDVTELAELKAVAGECESRDDAEQRIQEDPLSVEVRSGWTSIGETLEPEEFNILLGTGGPAVRIMGELDANKQPRRAWIEAQDWGTAWTQYFGDAVSQDDLLTYCSQFFFGE